MSAIDAEMSIVKEQMTRLEGAIAALSRDVLQVNPAKFRLMVEPMLDDLASLRAQLDNLLGVTAIRESGAALVLALDGENVRMGDARGSVVTHAIDAARRGVKGILAAMSQDADGLHVRAGRRQKWIEELADLPLTSLAPGSVKVLLGEPSTSELFEEHRRESFSRAVSLLGRAAAASTSLDELDGVLRQEPTPVRDAVLIALRDLAPPQGSDLESVTIGGKYAPSADAARLTRRTRGMVAAVAERFLQQDELLESVEGTLLAVDVGQNECTLRNVSNTTREVLCDFEDEFLPDVIALLGSRVRVAGERISTGKRQKLQMLSILPAEGDEGAEPGTE